MELISENVQNYAGVSLPDGKTPVYLRTVVPSNASCHPARARVTGAVHSQGTGMVGTFRPRRLAHVALLGALALGLAACAGEYPNSTFSHNTEYNTAIDGLWDKLLLLGTLVFIFTEAGLIYTIV